MTPSPDALAGAALVVATVSLAGFSLATRGSVPSAERVTREGGSLFLGVSLMHRGYALAQPLVRLAVRAGVAPDTITWTSLVLGAASGALLAGGLFGTAAWLLALSGLCDLLDGAVARETHTASAAGAALDSTLDRYVEFAVHAGALWWFSASPPLQLLVLSSLFGSFMVTYSTAKAEALGVTPPRGWMKRPERIVWLLLGLAVASITQPAALVFAFGAITLGANVSAVLRLRALRGAIRDVEFTATRPIAAAALQAGRARRSTRSRPGASPDA